MKKRIPHILAAVLLALACASGGWAEDGVGVKKRTMDMATRNLFHAVGGSLDRPLQDWNATISSPDITYANYVNNGTGNVAQPLSYVIDNRIYRTSGGTVDISAINSWTVQGNNTVCRYIFHIDANGVVNGTQGDIVPATAAGNATRTWPIPPDGVAVFAGLEVYQNKTAQFTPGTTALTSSGPCVNSWAYPLVGSPAHALKE